MEKYDIILHEYNETFVRVECDRSISTELGEYFSFFVPGYQFSPAYKKRRWDGRIRLYNKRTNLFYKGLIQYLYQFCTDREYTVAKTFKMKKGKPDIQALLDRLDIPEEYKPRDYQVQGYNTCIENHRAVILSPTASGKSFLIYLLTRHYDKKTLIIVPTISLTVQMAGDFRDYGYKERVQIIDGNADKIWKEEIEEQITVTTWQSIYEMPKSWFDQFEVVIGDEAHHFKSDSLKSIMTKCEAAKYRFALTGTLDESETHKLMIEALFGPVFELVTTKELMDAGHVAKLKINIILFKHKKPKLAGKTYFDERDYLFASNARNKYITDLAKKLPGNTIILYTLVDKHGRLLYDEIKNSYKKGQVFFIYGGTDGEQRESVRNILERETDAILVASYGTLSTGVNIRNLHNVIFASPSRSRIRNLQSIGRGLRTHKSKSHATLYDIADDLRTTKNQPNNFTLNHLQDRVRVYNEQEFDYTITKIDLEDE